MHNRNFGTVQRSTFLALYDDCSTIGTILFVSGRIFMAKMAIDKRGQTGISVSIRRCWSIPSYAVPLPLPHQGRLYCGFSWICRYVIVNIYIYIYIINTRVGSSLILEFQQSEQLTHHQLTECPKVIGMFNPRFVLDSRAPFPENGWLTRLGLHVQPVVRSICISHLKCLLVTKLIPYTHCNWQRTSSGFH